MLQSPLARPGRMLRQMMDGDTVVMPGAFSAFSARLAWRAGAQAVYLSGGAIANSELGAPDIALTTLNEVAGVAARACQAAPVPMLCDADTGFGDVFNVQRTVAEFERAGLAGLHLEDQVSPKRCGHLEGKSLVSTEDMARKIETAVAAKRDPDFLIFARTDARGPEGLNAAIDRMKRYRDVGADGLFPEGLVSEAEFEQVRAAIPDVPLLANMTEFGKTPLIPASRFRELGYPLVIFPVTALRVMQKRLEEFYGDLLSSGTQEGWMEKMATRAELYDAVGYPDYAEADKKLNYSGD